MARKRKNKQPDEKPQIEQGEYWTPNDATWGGFINVKLDDEQKQDFLVWFGERVEPLDRDLCDLLDEGMKVTFAYDRENQCFTCTFTGALVGNSNERYVTTSRAGTFTECMALALWKHIKLADGDYGNFRPATGQLNNWG